LASSLNISENTIFDLESSLINISASLDSIQTTAIDFPVSSVNGKTGNIVLKTSDLENDNGYLTSYV